VVGGNYGTIDSEYQIEKPEHDKRSELIADRARSSSAIPHAFVNRSAHCEAQYDHHSRDRVGLASSASFTTLRSAPALARLLAVLLNGEVSPAEAQSRLMTNSAP
jgi:hypothetical protein